MGAAGQATAWTRSGPAPSPLPGPAGNRTGQATAWTCSGLAPSPRPGPARAASSPGCWTTTCWTPSGAIRPQATRRASAPAGSGKTVLLRSWISEAALADGAHVRTRPVDHAPMVTAPAEVVDIILDAVRDAAGTSVP
jgi:hypothetical protein